MSKFYISYLHPEKTRMLSFDIEADSYIDALTEFQKKYVTDEMILQITIEKEILESLDPIEEFKKLINKSTPKLNQDFDEIIKKHGK